MGETNLGDLFEKYMNKEPLFVNRNILQSNYTPEAISHRDQQIDTIAKVLSPALRFQKPSNLFVYGKTGTGKTLTIKYTTQEMRAASKRSNNSVDVIFLNCKLKKIADTEYRLVAQLCRELGKAIPPTGLPTDEVYKIFFETIDAKGQIILLILDEIDQLVKKVGDEILYNLTRINTELTKSQVAIIGISNDLTFTEFLDPRVKSSLSEEEIIFPPYNAIQLKHILTQRSKLAFKKNVLEQGLLEKCAAFAAREHGDARRALELLRVAGEIAERDGNDLVKIEHLDIAEEKIEKDRVLDIISTQPKQHQATLYSIFRVCSKRKEMVFTGEIYEVYKDVCAQTGLRPLTQRRVSDIIAEFDMLGLINAKVISKGRYGRTREISLSTPKVSNPKIKKILETGLDLTA